MGLGVIRVQAERLFELRRRLGAPPERRKREAKIVVKGRKRLGAQSRG